MGLRDAIATEQLHHQRQEVSPALVPATRKESLGGKIDLGRGMDMVDERKVQGVHPLPFLPTLCPTPKKWSGQSQHLLQGAELQNQFGVSLCHGRLCLDGACDALRVLAGQLSGKTKRLWARRLWVSKAGDQRRGSRERSGLCF